MYIFFRSNVPIALLDDQNVVCGECAYYYYNSEIGLEEVETDLGRAGACKRLKQARFAEEKPCADYLDESDCGAL